jgi:hypothetical protein
MSAADTFIIGTVIAIGIAGLSIFSGLAAANFLAIAILLALLVCILSTS